jgi:FkbM family methyltransferase
MSDYNSWEQVLHHDVSNLVDQYFNDIKPGEIIYDVGANVGVFTDIVLKKYNNVTVVLFEPIVDYYNYLVNKYKDCENIAVYNCALIDSPRHLRISKDGNNLGYNTLAEIKEYGNFEDIKGAPLSQLIEAANLPLPDCIKVDVENSEYLFVEGCKGLFKSHLPRKIVIEIGVLEGHPLWEKEKEMMEYLFSLGYKRFDYEQYQATYEAVFTM